MRIHEADTSELGRDAVFIPYRWRLCLCGFLAKTDRGLQQHIRIQERHEGDREYEAQMEYDYADHTR